MKAVVAAFNQEKALVGAFSVITNHRMELFEALISTLLLYHLMTTPWQVGGDGGPLRARAQRQGGGRRVGEGGGPRQLRPRGHSGGAAAPVSRVPQFWHR